MDVNGNFPGTRLPLGGTGQSSLKAPWLPGLILVAANLLAFAGDFSTPFLLDDQPSVVDNLSIRSLADWRAVLSPAAATPTGGRPLSNLTFAIDYAFGGIQPAGYRMTNLALHLVSTLLLFGLLRRILRAGGPVRQTAGLDAAALIAALAWALHPVQAGTVGYIAQRTELLMGLFYLLTLYGVVRGAAGPRGWLVVSAVACACGMGSKEVMVTAPVVVLLLDRCFLAGSFSGAWRARRAYYLALAATWVLLVLLLPGLRERAVGYGMDVTAWTYALTESRAVLIYLARVLWPHPLIFDYGPDFLGTLSEAAPYVAGLALLLALAGWLLVRFPRAGFGAAAFFLLLAPTSSFVPVVTQPIAENRLYLPLACGAGLLGGILCRFARGWVGRVWALLPVALLILSRERSALLRDPVALWRETLLLRPGNARVHANLGAAYFAAGRIDGAIHHAREAIRLRPGAALPRSNLAAALIKRGSAAEALVVAQEAFALDPRIKSAALQVGNALVLLGRYADAIPWFRREIELVPDSVEAWTNLGAAVVATGQPAEGIGPLQTALRFNSKHLDAHNNLGVAWLRLGRLDEAERAFAAALLLQPDSQVARDGMVFVRGARAASMR